MDPAVLIFSIIGVRNHHALAQHTLRRFVRIHHARVAQQPVVKAEIHQVKDGVLDTSDVLVDGQPVPGPVIQLRIGIRAAIPGVIPGRFHEGIKCVGLAFRRSTALRTARLAPLRVSLDR